MEPLPSSLALELPFPPTINTYYTVARGRKILSAKGRMYKQMCILPPEARLLMQGDVSVTVMLEMPDKRKRDIDNYVKAVLDVLTDNGVYQDDSQIKLLTVFHGGFTKGGRCEVEIESLAAKRALLKQNGKKNNIVLFPGMEPSDEQH